MNETYKKIIKIIIIICIIILIVDIIYFIYGKFILKSKQRYSDIINSFEIIDDGIISVGSSTKNGYEQAKLTKYTTNNKKQWEKMLNKKYNSSYFSIKQDNNYFIAVGNYEANKKENEDKVRSALIVKYDEDGKIIKEKRFQVLGNSKFTSVIVVPDGYIVAGQSIYENMTLGLSDKGGAFLIKYDKNLNEIWRSNYGGSKSAVYNDLIIVNDNIYAVGKDATNTGIISKYNMDGTRINTTNYSYTDSIGFTSIVNMNNMLYVVGAKKVDKNKSSYDTDSLIVKYDYNCEKVSEKIYRGKGIERFNKAIVNNNQIIVVGQTGIYNKKKSTNKENVFDYNSIFAIYNDNLDKLKLKNYKTGTNNYFTDIKENNNKFIVSIYGINKSYGIISNFIFYNNFK